MSSGLASALERRFEFAEEPVQGGSLGRVEGADEVRLVLEQAADGGLDEGVPGVGQGYRDGAAGDG